MPRGTKRTRKEQLLKVTIVLCFAAVASVDVTLRILDSTPTNRAAASLTTKGVEHDVFPRALEAFTQVLHDDSETIGLRSWTWKSEDTSHSRRFDGLTSSLLQDAFGKQRVGFVGDSTLLYMGTWLQKLLSLTEDNQQMVDSLENRTLSQANQIVNPTNDKHCGVGDKPRITTAEYDFKWVGYSGNLNGKQACQFDQTWEEVRAMKPTIMVVNWGLHWMHLQGGGRDIPPCSVNHWLHYEEDWLEKALQVAQDVGTKLILFKTSNFICEARYTGQYATTVARYKQERLQSGNHTTATKSLIHDVCVEQLQARIGSTFDISKADILRYCQEATFDAMGSHMINRRIRKFVQVKQKQQSSNASLTIALFDDHAVQSCPYTDVQDGRHYRRLGLLRIRLLANLIQALVHK